MYIMLVSMPVQIRTPRSERYVNLHSCVLGHVCMCVHMYVYINVCTYMTAVEHVCFNACADQNASR